MFKFLKVNDKIRYHGADFYVSRVTHDNGWVVIETTGTTNIREHGDTGLFRYVK
jgi:predicted TPR repeat methyltransferase